MNGITFWFPFAAFRSSADNLVTGDTNARSDVFVRDLVLGTTLRASTRTTGAESNGNSSQAALSDDGRFVAFASDATDLVTGATTVIKRVYLKDLSTGAVELVSGAAPGVQADGMCTYPCLSSDARLVAFSSNATNLVAGDSNAKFDSFVRDRLTGTLERVSTASNGAQSDGDAHDPALSGDGRYVVFWSLASNLVAGDTNNAADVFLKDRVSGATTRISRGWNGAQAAGGSGTPAITRDGRYIAFSSDATNIVQGDVNGQSDLFVFDRALGTAELASRSSAGVQADQVSGWPSLSDDARSVAFESFATNLVPADGNASGDIFVHDRACSVANYCTAKTNSLGCVPAITSTGGLSLSGSDDLHVLGANVLSRQNGLLVWGLRPRAYVSLGGYLCVAPPFVRTAVLTSNGNASTVDCSGVYDFHFSHAYAAANAVAAGSTLYAQFVSRDPGAPGTTGLTDGLRLEICP
jgi:Tol biopolymer transport system component